MKHNNKSNFQERLVCLFLRLNGYLQSGFISHSAKWGNVGTEIDRICIRFPNHSQDEREVSCYEKLHIPNSSIDIIIAEVKNNSLRFNNSLSKIKNGAEKNWKQILQWIGLFTKEEIDHLVPKMINIVKRNCLSDKGSFPKCVHKNKYGEIIIRPILFSIETKKTTSDTQMWINGHEILEFLWDCFCPELIRKSCSTSYPLFLWGQEFADIVVYIKNRHKKGLNIGTLEELYLAIE